MTKLTTEDVKIIKLRFERDFYIWQVEQLKEKIALLESKYD